MKRQSKKYKDALAKIDKNKVYEIEEAIKAIKETSTTNFEATVEVAVRLNVDPRKADEQVRGVVKLPNGSGKTKKTLVICDASKFEEAKKSGTDYFGDEEMISKIEKENFFDYDVVIATPDMMPKLGKIAKILGPKGLMPNPKTGTVTNNIQKTVEDIKGGQVEYRCDSYGIIHGIIGKVNFKEESLKENLDAYMSAIIKAKPQNLKGKYIKTVYLTTTMGPSVKLNVLSFDK